MFCHGSVAVCPVGHSLIQGLEGHRVWMRATQLSLGGCTRAHSTNLVSGRVCAARPSTYWPGSGGTIESASREGRAAGMGLPHAALVTISLYYCQTAMVCFRERNST